MSASLRLLESYGEDDSDAEPMSPSGGSATTSRMTRMWCGSPAALFRCLSAHGTASAMICQQLTQYSSTDSTQWGVSGGPSGLGGPWQQTGGHPRRTKYSMCSVCVFRALT